MEQKVTLMDLITNNGSVKGYEMEQLVNEALDSLDDEEVAIANELVDKYFTENDTENYKPLKFVYYWIGKTKEGEYALRRNLTLSPRSSLYFSKEISADDILRDVIRFKTTVLGSDLKAMVKELTKCDFEFPSRDKSQEEKQQIAFHNLSIQIADYIREYFIDCDKPIKDDVYYGISCKEYGTAVVYRDLNKSPRPQYNTDGNN